VRELLLLDFVQNDKVEGRMRKSILRISRLVIILALTFSGFGFSPTTRAENCDWSMFRGNPQHTGLAPDSCGLKTDNLETIWRVKIGVDRFHSEGASPITLNDCLYIGGSDNRFYCIDIKNGQQKWAFKTSRNIEGAASVYKNMVYFGCSDAYLYCLNIGNGDEIWSYKAGFAMNSSPLVNNGSIFFHDRLVDFICLDANTGKLLWKDGGDDNYGGASSPAISLDGENLFTGRGGYFNSLLCLNSSSGDLIWQFDVKDEIISSPAIDGEIVVFGCNDGNVYCLNANTGEKFWSYRTENDLRSSPCCYKGKVYIGTKDGYFVCLDEQTGKPIWKYNSPDTEYSSGAICNNRIYFGGDKGNVYILDTESGKELGHLTVEDQEFLSQPVISGDKVYICSQDYTYCLGDKPPQKPSKITVDPHFSEIEIGQTIQLKALILDENDKAMNGEIVWSVDNPNVVSISKDGKVIGKKIGKATIKACYQNVCSTAEVEVYDKKKIAKITISPTFYSLIVGESATFSATAYNFKDEIINDVSFQWSVKPSELGDISSTGVFIAKKEGEATITVSSSEISATAKVTILQAKKPANITVNPQEINFGTVEAGSTKIIQVILINDGEQDTEVRVVTSDSWIKLNQNSIKIKSFESVKLDIEANIDSQEKVGKKEGQITIKWDDKLISIRVLVEIKKKAPLCEIKTTPSELFFGKILRGKSLTLPFIIKSSKDSFSGTCVTSAPWIEVSPRDFNHTGKDIEGTVTIKASLLPTGEEFEGYIDVTSKDKLCQTSRIKIIVRTDKDISLKLKVGDKKAQLNQDSIDMDVPPQVVGGRTLIPIRFISEAFGSKVEWEASTGKITITRLDFTIVLWKDKKNAKVNGKDTTLDVPATINQGRTLVPLRFISEAFGAKVDWDQKSKSISIFWQPN